MEIKELSLPGLFVIIPDTHKDKRGYFFESFRGDMMTKFDLPSKISSVHDPFSLSLQLYPSFHDVIHFHLLLRYQYFYILLVSENPD